VPLFEQAVGFALLAAFSPTALLIAAVFLVSARPGRMAVMYLAGGLLIVAVIGTITLVAMRAGGLSLVGERQARYGLRLGLGVVAMIAALVLALRKPKPPDQVRPRRPSLVSRISARLTPLSAFAAGVVVFGPGLSFIAAVQVVASARASLAVTVGAMAMIVVLTVLCAWLPLVAYLIAPEATVSRLTAFNAWLRCYGRVLLSGVVAIIGIALVIQGIAGLA
jgi:Sap, sulfolipid-1-addressing protein